MTLDQDRSERIARARSRSGVTSEPRQQAMPDVEMTVGGPLERAIRQAFQPVSSGLADDGEGMAPQSKTASPDAPT